MTWPSSRAQFVECIDTAAAEHVARRLTSAPDFLSPLSSVAPPMIDAYHPEKPIR